MRQALAALLALSSVLAGAGVAPAADYPAGPDVAVANTALVPSCEDPRVLAQVEDQFEYGVQRTVPAQIAVVEFSELYEKNYQPRTYRREIERRYCQGTALVSTGERRTLYYVVEYPLGYAGVSWRAEGCILGFDPWHVYGANCESLRRF